MRGMCLRRTTTAARRMKSPHCWWFIILVSRLIRRDGEVVQYVPFDKRAWHAGVSMYHGRERCNDFSIGIELEGTDTTPYTDSQYQQLAALTRTLIGLYPAIADNITGHSDIAPARKTDPGPAFDWPRLRAMLTASPE